MKTALGDIEIVSRLGADERTLAFDVLDGLTRPFKEIPPKHFYDTEGSRLFEAICHLPEYYPTRTERAILEANAAAIVEETGAAELVELGSGVPTKTLLLLDAMREAGTLDRYMPFDVSEVVLHREREDARRALPGAARVRRGGRLRAPPRRAAAGRGPARDRLPRRHDRQLPARLAAAVPALARRARCARRTGCCSAPTWSSRRRCWRRPTTTRRASPRRSTATCSRCVNRELDADFDLDAFEHVAFYDREQEWIEMRLRALGPHGGRGAQARARPCTSPTARSCARRSARSSPASGWRPTCARPGLVLHEFLTDPDDLFALSLMGR